MPCILMNRVSVNALGPDWHANHELWLLSLMSSAFKQASACVCRE